MSNPHFKFPGGMSAYRDHIAGADERLVKAIRTDVLPRVTSDSYAGFLRSVCEQFAKKGTLSPAQRTKLEEAVARVNTAPAPRPVPAAVAASNGLLKAQAFLHAAQGRKAWPTVSLAGGYLLTVCGPTAKVPGAINVFSGDRSVWYGRFDKGVATGRDLTPAILAIVEAFGNDPASVAKSYGDDEKRCCFCDIALTDPRSKAAGYGPICAGNYNLPWGE